MKNSLTTLLAALLLSACATQRSVDIASDSPEQALADGLELLRSNQTAKAIKVFDALIGRCESLHAGDMQVYAARSPQEASYYQQLAAEAKHDVLVTSSICADVLFLKANASIDLGRIDAAEDLLKRALAMSPANATYLSELGHVYHVKKDWNTAQALFVVAEGYADTLAPLELRDMELLRAKRGISYSLVELGLLDEAEKKLRECLAIDDQDGRTLSELNYIESLREQVPESESPAQRWEF